VDAATLVALQTDVDTVRAAPREKALLKLAAVMTRAPDRSAAEVRQALRAGCAPEEVQETVFLVAMYNMANRVADAYAYPPDALHPYDPNASLPFLSCPGK
jgi:alkylhydroperoxidase family enzyme